MTWRLDDESRGRATPDVSRFVDSLETLGGYFDRAAPVSVARAPGRLDVMGGIADYSGSLVLQLPLADATRVAAQASDDRRVTVRSRAADTGGDPEASLPIDALVPGGMPIDYAAARALFDAPALRWAAYAAGALVVLGRERGVSIDRGLRLLVDSTVPLGKGVASSAAMEVAAMRAIADVLGVSLGGRELALLCQLVENRVVGAPCGVMDQMTASCGQAQRLLALRCQPAELEGHVALPVELGVWGIDSGIRHEVGGADYVDVRVGTFMGYRIIADVAGLTVRDVDGGHVAIDDTRWGGYLANVTPSQWASTYGAAVPVAIDGAAFLRRYRGTTDDVTHVDPARAYAVRAPTAHPIHEHHRVRLFRATLEAGAATEAERVLLGELMHQSHASYGACGLGSSGTDRLVALVRAAGVSRRLYGAKITGGGSGGVVAVLGRADARDAVEAVARAYERETGRPAAVLGGSSAGAMSTGVVRLVAR